MHPSRVYNSHLVYTAMDLMLPFRLGANTATKNTEIMPVRKLKGLRRCCYIRLRWATKIWSERCCFICLLGEIIEHDDSFESSRTYTSSDGKLVDIVAKGACLEVELLECVAIVVAGETMSPATAPEYVREMWMEASKSQRSKAPPSMTVNVYNGSVMK